MSTRQDFDTILLSKDVEQRLEDLRDSGRLDALPEVLGIIGFGGGQEGHKDLWGHTKRVVAQTVPRVLVRWAALFHDVGKPQCFSRKQGEVSFYGHETVSARMFRRAANRLGWFARDESDEIEFLVKHLGHVEEYDSSWSDSAVRRLAKLAGLRLDDLLALARADVTTKHSELRKAHHGRVSELGDRAVALALEDAKVRPMAKGVGDALMKEFRLPPSRELGVLMGKLIEAVEAGELRPQATHEEVISFVKSKAWAC